MTFVHARRTPLHAVLAAAGFLFILLILGPHGSGAEVPFEKPGPAVQVLTLHEGMPAWSVEKTITNRVERWVNQAEGIRRIESHTITGASIVRIHFRPDIDPAAALVQVNTLALAALPNLPRGTLPPVVLPLRPGTTHPLGVVTVSNPTLDEAVLKDLARIEVRNALGAIEHAMVPAVLGGKDRIVVVYLDTKRMVDRQVLPLDVVSALRAASRVVMPGTVDLADRQLTLRVSSGMSLIDEINALPIRTKPGDMVLLRDIGYAGDSHAVQTSRVRVNGQRSVCLPIYVGSEGKPAAVRERLAGVLPQLRERLPRGTRLEFVPFALGREGNDSKDTGLITLSVRAPSGLRLDASEKRVAEVERFLEANIPAPDREAIVSELGVNADLSVALTRNSGQHDTTIRVVLSRKRSATAREYVGKLRRLFEKEPRFADLNVRFNADDTQPPLAIQIEGGTRESAAKLAQEMRRRVSAIRGTADVQVVQRVDAPSRVIEVDRQKAAAVGLSEHDVLTQVAAAMNASSPHDQIVWTDSKSGNHYRVAIQYPKDPKAQVKDMLNVPVVGTNHTEPITLSSFVSMQVDSDAVEINHIDLVPVFTVRANVDDRDPREVAADIEKTIKGMEVPEGMRVRLEVAGRRGTR